MHVKEEEIQRQKTERDPSFSYRWEEPRRAIWGMEKDSPSFSRRLGSQRTSREAPKEGSFLTRGQESPESPAPQVQETYPRRASKVRSLPMGLFTILLVGIGVLSMTMEKPTVSEVEKRQLAAQPAFSWQGWFDGSFTKEADTFFADTFPWRDWLVSLSGSIKENLGVRYDDARIIGAAQDPVDQNDDGFQNVREPAKEELTLKNEKPPQQGEVPPSQPEEPYPPQPEDTSQPEEMPAEDPAASFEDDIGSNKSGVFIYKGMGMSLFGGNTAVGQQYASNINAYHEALEGKVRVFDMVVPTSSEFYLPEKYQSLTNSQKNAIDSIYSYLAPGVTGVDAYSALAAHTDEYLYFNTDHHWTGRGAYYAYTAFAEAAGFTPLDINTDYSVQVIDGFLGFLYNQTQDSKMREKGDYVEYFIPENNATATIVFQNQPYYKAPWSVWAEWASGGNSYLVFLGGDAPMIQIDTGVQNGKSIAVVKESFGNAFAPFLVPHYEHIYVVDERYFQTSLVEFLQENEVDDLLFLNNSFSAMTAYHANNLQKMMYQVFVPPEPEEESSQTEEQQEDDKWRGVHDDDEDDDDEDDRWRDVPSNTNEDEE